MKKLIVSLLILANCGQNTQKTTLQTNISETLTVMTDSQQSAAPFRTLIDSSLIVPESVTVYNGITYIANLGENPNKSLGQGFITQIKDNTPINIFVGLLDAPKGFDFLDNDTIIISDHPNVKILKLSTGKVITSVNLNPGFLNDLVLIDSSTALLSDTKKGLVYKVNINSDRNQLTVGTISGITENGINGLAWDDNNKMLYFVTSTFGGDKSRGHIFEVKLDDTYTIATQVNRWDTPKIGMGGLDGLALGEQKLVLSDWGNGENDSYIYIYDIKTRSLVASIGGTLTSVADITLNDTELYMPEFLKNRVSIVDLSHYL
ncbi:MAG: hypothetical protein ACRCWI_07315 [Brevinema sp.]